MSEAVAAIDCGTNSIRLLVARAEDGRLVDLDRRMLTVRLGEGVDRTGTLSAEALDRTFAACRGYGDVIAELGVERLRFVATSASRDASNAAEFTAGVAAILGVVPEVISGSEEAELSYAGATSGLSYREPVLVFDIGGGSTEFVLGDQGGVVASISVDMGCVRFHERYLTTDPIPPVELVELEAAADRMMDEVLEHLDISGVRDVVGLAGTVTTVTAMALGLGEYDPDLIHGARVGATEVAAVAARLAAMPISERRALGVMHSGRADVIVSGATILAVILRRIGAESLLASEHDILDGLVWSLLDEGRHPR